MPRKTKKLQEKQVEEHREIVQELKKGRRDVSRDLTDTLLKLDALTDNLESTLWNLKDMD